MFNFLTESTNIEGSHEAKRFTAQLSISDFTQLDSVRGTEEPMTVMQHNSKAPQFKLSVDQDAMDFNTAKFIK